MITTALILCATDYKRFVVEGDDCLVAVPPSKLDRFRQILESFGMRVKMEVHDRPGDCGFCHQWWAEDQSILTDPRHRLRQIAYSHDKTDPQGQINARGLSLYAEHSQCPILGAVARSMI